MKTLLKNAYISRSSKRLRFFVLNIEHRAHLIAILGLETSVIKIDVAHQFRVDETQTFLLTVADQVRTKDFEIVYIDQVFIIVATPNSVLRSQFIIAADKNFDQAFHPRNWRRDT